jgi:hypothetical protein
MLPLVEGAFGGTGLGIGTGTRAMPGETGDVIKAGFERVVGFSGLTPEFHTERDDGSATDLALLGSILAATLRLARLALRI